MKVLKCVMCGKEVEVAEETTKVICSTCINDDKKPVMPSKVEQKIPEEDGGFKKEEIEKVAKEIIGGTIKESAPKKVSRSSIIKDLLKQDKPIEEILSKLKEAFPDVPEARLRVQISVIKSTKKKAKKVKLSSFEVKDEGQPEST